MAIAFPSPLIGAADLVSFGVMEFSRNHRYSATTDYAITHRKRD
jgi:hypothetical protein